MNYYSLDTDLVRAFLSPDHVALSDQLRSFAHTSLAPMGESADDTTARAEARTIVQLLGRGGWLAPIASGDLRALTLTREAVAYASPLADAVLALQGLGTAPLLSAAADNPTLRQYADAALRGDAIAAFAMTEREAGSDVASMTTRATRDGDEYVLNGAKTLISNAGIADFYTVFATTNPGAGSRGISCFVIPSDAPGFRYLGPLVMSAAHPLGEIAFENCRIPISHRVGEENGGFRVGMTTLDRLRPTVAAAACGFAARALDEAIAHAMKRQQFGAPLASFQLTKLKLARMATDLAAARLLTYRAVWEKDAGADRITMEAAMSKSFGTEAAQRIVDDAVQIIGGLGVLAAHPVDRLYRSVRALRIYEGATEIQQLVLADLLLKDAAAS